jgi:pilus assembly protein CpaF
MVTVKISEKDGQQTTYQFDKPEVTIGRMKGNDIVLPKGNVSKKHARLIKDGSDLKVDDLNSTNGTYVNGRKVTAQTDVSEDDKIYIGDFILQLQPESEQAQSGPPSPPGADNNAPAGASGGPTNPPSPSGPGQSSPGGDRPKPPSGSSRPNASPTGGGPNASSTGGSSSQSTPPAPDDKADRKESNVSHPPGGSAGGTSQGPAGTPSGATPASSDSSGESSLDKRFSSGASPSADNDGTPDNGSPAPDSHSGGSQSGKVSPDPPPSTDRNEPSVPADSVKPEPTGRDDSERPAMDGGRGHSSVASSVGMAPTPLTDNFEEDLQELHEAAAAALLDEVGGIDALPIDYPAPTSERESLATAVSDAVGSVDAGRHADRLEEVLLDEAVGLGPIEELLDDADVDAIYVNDYDRVITRRGDDIVREPIAFGDPDLLLLSAQRLLGERHAPHAADRVRFSDGTTARVAVPPLTMHGPVLSIECPVVDTTLDDMIERDTMNDQMASLLRSAVIGAQTVLVVGPDDHGRRELLASLCAEIPEAARTIGVSEADLTTLNRPTATQLDASPGEDWTRDEVIRAAHQLNPDRLVVDELEGSEAAGWARAAVGGAAGSLATIYGQNLEDGLDRLHAAGQVSQLPGGALDRAEIATAVDVVVLVGRRHADQPRIMRIAELEDLDYDRFRLNDIFRYRVEDEEAEFVATGFVPTFYEILTRADDTDVPSDLFDSV